MNHLIIIRFQISKFNIFESNTKKARVFKLILLVIKKQLLVTEPTTFHCDYTFSSSQRSNKSKDASDHL